MPSSTLAAGGSGGLRADKAVGLEVLKVVEPLAVEASLQAIEEFNREVSEEENLIDLELENAEYVAQRAYKQYNQADPENRLVCANLEKSGMSILSGLRR